MNLWHNIIAMTVAQNKIGQNEKPAPIRVRPGLWINLTRPEFYMSYCDVSQEKFAQLLHKDNIGKWSRKTNSAPSCDHRLTWHRNDAKSSIIVDDDGRQIASEWDILEPGGKVNWSCGQTARKGDLSLFYRTAPAMDIRYLLLVEGNAKDRTEVEPGRVWPIGCDCIVAYKFQVPLLLEDIRQAGVHIRQTTAISVAETNWRRLNEMLAKRNPSYPKEILKKFGIDIFAGIPPSTIESSATDENSLADSLDSWAASPATYERLTRPEQGKFRERVIRAYGGFCAITGESCNAVLEAAHLPGRDHKRHNLASDGVLLRIDLHRLLDTGLMTFTAKGIIQINRKAGVEYRKLHGQTIRFPKRKSDHPQL